MIEYAGSHWKFDAGQSPNPPPGWGNEAVIYLRTLDDGTVQALGPDGLVYRLIETNQTQPTACVSRVRRGPFAITMSRFAPANFAWAVD